MGKRNHPPNITRKRAQMLLGSGTGPANFKPVAGFIFTDSSLVPDHMQQYSSATYSLGSPLIGGIQQFAVTVFSLASPNIPGNLLRVAILPES